MADVPDRQPPRPESDALRRAEIEALLADLGQLGARFHRLRFVLVEWQAEPGTRGRQLIEGPRGYRHPYYDTDPPELREDFEVTGLQLISNSVGRPGGRRAYAMLSDGDDPKPRQQVEGLTGRKFRPKLAPVLGLFDRAARLVGHMESVRVLGTAGRDEMGWLVALLDLTEPDQRFTWGEAARRLWGPKAPRDGVALCFAVGRTPDRDTPVCHVIEDVVHASQVALRRLLLESPVTPVAPLESRSGRATGKKAQVDPLLLDLDDDGVRLELGGSPLASTRREKRGGPLTKRFIGFESDEARLLLSLTFPPGVPVHQRPETPSLLRRALKTTAVRLNGRGKAMKLVPCPKPSVRLRKARDVMR